MQALSHGVKIKMIAQFPAENDSFSRQYLAQT